MEYKVIRGFTDRTDSHKYAVGDRYPYRGFAKKERAEELSTSKNRRGVALIEVVKKAVKAEPVEEVEEATVEEATVEETKKKGKK